MVLNIVIELSVEILVEVSADYAEDRDITNSILDTMRLRGEEPS